MHPVESADVMNLGEDRQRQHLADARHRSQPVERIAIVPFRHTHEREFQVGDERVVTLEKCEVDLDAFSDTCIGTLV